MIILRERQPPQTKLLLTFSVSSRTGPKMEARLSTPILFWLSFSATRARCVMRAFRVWKFTCGRSPSRYLYHWVLDAASPWSEMWMEHILPQ